MTFMRAAHGFMCGARTIPIRCRYCRASIFYFSCSCGSRVLFEELGQPWPKHRCVDHFDGLVEGVGKARLERLMAVQMKTVRVDWTYEQWVRTAFRERSQTTTQPKPQPREIARMDPYAGAEAEEEGLVRALIPSVDIHRRFGVGERTLGEAALGDLGRRSLAQVTIHTGALGEDDFSFTFLVDRTRLAEDGIRTDDLVRCRLRGVAVLDQDPVWVCDDFELLP